MTNRYVFVLTACVAGSFALSALAADDPLDKQLKAAREAAVARGADTSDPNVKRQLDAQRKRDQEKKDLAEYKTKTKENLAAIKELFAKGEEAWKGKFYGVAAPYYQSVAMATVPGAEEMAETSRNHLMEMEEIAKGLVKSANDAELARDYLKAVGDLSNVTKNFRMTKAKENAERRLTALKSKPEVAAYVDMAQGESYEAEGKVTEAMAVYTAVASNPRYENSLPALRAQRKINEMEKNDDVKAKLKAELTAKADREAPALINSAKNFVSNKMPKKAMEKYQTVIEKFPGSPYAAEAEKALAELK